MYALLLGDVLLFIAWITGLLKGLDWIWLFILGIPILLLPLLTSKSLWKRKKDREKDSEEQQGAEKKKVPTDANKVRAPDLEEPSATGRREGWQEGDEEDREREVPLSHLVLQDFYAIQVYKGRRDPPHEYCNMVTALIDSLLQGIQTFGSCSQAVFQENCVGVGSMFEGWGVSRGDQVPVYDVMVIISPPDGFSFDVELAQHDRQANLQKQEGAASHPPLPRHSGMARVRVQADPNLTRLRSFSFRTRLSDFVDRVQVERLKEGLDYMLEECLMIGQYMEPIRMLCWLGSALRRAWVFRGGVKLSFWVREWPCIMRLENPAGRVLYINVVPAVRFPNSDVCVVARGPASKPWQEFWEVWFCSDEDYFLRSAASSLPGNSCHQLCLEILTFLNRPVSPFSTRVATFLGSYHLKTILLHLLLAKKDPQDWEGVYLVERLQDMIAMLRRCLSERQLLSFWIGNPGLGERLQTPFSSAEPLNLFSPLARHKGWHGLATMEFKRLLARLRELPESTTVSCLVPREALSPKCIPSGLVTSTKAPSACYRGQKRAQTTKGATKKLSWVGEFRLNPVSELPVPDCSSGTQHSELTKY